MMQRQSRQLPYAAAERWLLIYSTILVGVLIVHLVISVFMKSSGLLVPSAIITALAVWPYIIWWQRLNAGVFSYGAALTALITTFFLSIFGVLAVIVGPALGFLPRNYSLMSVVEQLYNGTRLLLPICVAIALVWCCVIMIKRKRRIQ